SDRRRGEAEASTSVFGDGTGALYPSACHSVATLLCSGGGGGEREAGEVARGDLAERFLDAAVGADQVGDARGGGRLDVVAGAIGEPDLAVHVGEQLKVEGVLLGELAVVVDGIEADAEDGDVLVAEVVGSI